MSGRQPGADADAGADAGATRPGSAAPLSGCAFLTAACTHLPACLPTCSPYGMPPPGMHPYGMPHPGMHPYGMRPPPHMMPPPGMPPPGYRCVAPPAPLPILPTLPSGLPVEFLCAQRSEGALLKKSSPSPLQLHATSRSGSDLVAG